MGRVRLTRAGTAGVVTAAGAGVLTAGMWVAFGLGAALLAAGIQLLAWGLLAIDVDDEK